MIMENMPGCCTASILFSFGEHGEASEVSVQKIKEMCRKDLDVVDLGGEAHHGHKRVIVAISVDPINIALLKEAGFKVIDRYNGIQGIVHIMTLHAASLK